MNKLFLLLLTYYLARTAKVGHHPLSCKVFKALLFFLLSLFLFCGGFSGVLYGVLRLGRGHLTRLIRNEPRSSDVGLLR